MSAVIVRSPDPVALVGGADVAPELINILQRHSACFVAADGGANHLAAAQITPAAIIGDMDSLSNKVKHAFSSLIHQSSDQNTTDFEKAVQEIEAPLIIAAGFLGGRLDHTVAVLNTMSRGNMRHVILVSEDDVCFLAKHSVTQLKLPIGTRIGLLPMSARVQTMGLKWDIKDAGMTFDGYISTSNETAAEDVTVHAMGQLFLTLPLSALDVVLNAVRGQ